jgi:hypothetical protein
MMSRCREHERLMTNKKGIDGPRAKPPGFSTGVYAFASACLSPAQLLTIPLYGRGVTVR